MSLEERKGPANDNVEQGAGTRMLMKNLDTALAEGKRVLEFDTGSFFSSISEDSRRSAVELFDALHDECQVAGEVKDMVRLKPNDATSHMKLSLARERIAYALNTLYAYFPGLRPKQEPE